MFSSSYVLEILLGLLKHKDETGNFSFNIGNELRCPQCSNPGNHNCQCQHCGNLIPFSKLFPCEVYQLKFFFPFLFIPIILLCWLIIKNVFNTDPHRIIRAFSRKFTPWLKQPDLLNLMPPSPCVIRYTNMWAIIGVLYIYIIWGSLDCMQMYFFQLVVY